MDNQNFTYEGCVQIYLEGAEALWIQQMNDNGSIAYTVGSSKTPIYLLDNRKEPIEAARRTINGDAGANFPDTFNLPAKVRLKADPDSVEIVLEDCKGQPVKETTLWMGVADRDEIPANPFYWYQLQAVDDRRIAFAVLVP